MPQAHDHRITNPSLGNGERVRRRGYVHPFPARMAPDLALSKIELLTTRGQRVLDPMCGSGTVVRLAADQGRSILGADIDPLAVLMTRTACREAWSRNLSDRAGEVVRTAKKLDSDLPPWVRNDDETDRFVRYWFAPRQMEALSKLARVLRLRPATDDPLRVALSRLIVTKDRGASLARDTAHSRPHRTRDTNDFDVYAEFLRSAELLEALRSASPTLPRPRIRQADARSLGFIPPDSIDLIITSPPYLNAIDYLRGHRLTLVWLGWTLSELRTLRSVAVGAERGVGRAPQALRLLAGAASSDLDYLPTRDQHMVLRYARDMSRLCRSLSRVLRAQGHVVFVVADSRRRGVPISNSRLCRVAAELHGLATVEEEVRPLPERHRYLPPPATASSALGLRMKEETVLTLVKR